MERNTVIKSKSFPGIVKPGFFKPQKQTFMNLSNVDAEFEEIVHPVIKWLNDNHHPHVTIIITSTNAELVEGIKSTGQILDYVKD